MQTFATEAVQIPADNVTLHGDLTIPSGADGVVAFAHGSGSSRRSKRNQYAAQVLQNAGLATLLFDLLSEKEGEVDAYFGHLRFDIPFLADRLNAATEWLALNPATSGLRVGYFGASTGAAAALVTAAKRGEQIGAVVSRGGRPDMADDRLPQVKAPTLLIVGANDDGVVELNQDAYRKLTCEKELVLIPDATHLFEEPGALEQAAGHARDWFVRHLHAVRA